MKKIGASERGPPPCLIFKVFDGKICNEIIKTKEKTGASDEA